ncbi:acyl-CoA N-acyltransferase [Earliella scabrosa]|nr:acyl-CoA N-acyltransferase [Earliella scabrosa]
MSFVNNYTPPPPGTGIPFLPRILPEPEQYGPTPYDINFAFPIHLDTLQSDRIKLVPFIPAVHASTFWENLKDNTHESFRYYPFRLSALSQALSMIELTFRQNPNIILFAVIDKTKPDPEHPDWEGSLAGIVSLLNTVPLNLTTEIGFVMVFPAFRRTHVAKSMIGLLLRYALELPSASPPGLGFRRVQYSAHPDNAPSIALAERLGFRKEGVMRWMWVLPDELAEAGRKGREGDATGGKTGRDAAILALCWDDWENGARERVEGIIRP